MFTLNSHVWASILTSIAVTSLINGTYVIVIHHSISSLDTVFQIAGLIIRVLEAAFSLLLIIATHREQAVMIIPWLLITLVTVSIEGSFLAFMLSELAVGNLNARLYNLATHVSVSIYFLLVVFSYYREVRNKSRTSSVI